MPDRLHSCSVGVPGHCLASRIAAIAIPLALAVAACASGVSSPPPPGAASQAQSGSATPAAPASPAAPTPTQAPDTGPGAASAAPDAASPDVTEAPPTGLEATPFGSPAPPVTIDESLAALLPDSVDGLPVERSEETENAALTSPTLGTDADGFAAVQVATADLADLAIASIVHLKGSTDPDAFYADWRPGFDDAVCAPAGGVSTTEVRTMGGRSVDTTLCTEGARVFHVRLDDGRILLSILDVGTRGFGEGLIEGLDG